MGRRETIGRYRAAEPLESRGFAGVLGAGGLVGLREELRDCVEGVALWQTQHLSERGERRGDWENLLNESEG